MATTRIMPLHVGKGRTESRAISDIIDYVANPKKTDNGRQSNYSAEQAKHQTGYVDQPRAEPDKKRQYQNDRCSYDHQQTFQNLHSSSSFQRSRIRCMDKETGCQI